jgi:hypothetical protein
MAQQSPAMGRFMLALSVVAFVDGVAAAARDQARSMVISGGAIHAAEFPSAAQAGVRVLEAVQE